MTMRIIIMCKAPVAGKVKTRLMTHYSAEQAAALHMAMATTVIERAKRLFDDVVIAVDDCTHPFFTPFALPLLPQGEGDLGQRMHRQVQQAFSDDIDAVMLLGTDSPHMPDARLLVAAAQVNHHDVIIGPVEDGGYDLIAMSQALALFDHVVWSSKDVLKQTLANVDALGLSNKQLDIAFDVDFPADIERAKQAGW
ncbi:TIGR04282 family arsenosugar biosynthesis glycosyltransferase, partial [Mariprofundus ferrooxydans]|nr:TIGR04282 family arsenosugar biosynthesis glycosyltransferase [Mariprofundus ferrooxydans]